MTTQNANSAADTLSAQQQAILPIAAFAAAGDMGKLNAALNQGLDAGLTISDAREILVQLYAYTGFPRSLNALTELMKVLDARKQRGITDAPGREPSRAIPKGDALRAAGTANQTKLVGQPVQGPIFEFAPAIGEYLQTHLFGDIFERDNLDWQSRGNSHRRLHFGAARRRGAVALAHAGQPERGSDGPADAASRSGAGRTGRRRQRPARP